MARARVLAGTLLLLVGAGCGGPPSGARRGEGVTASTAQYGPEGDLSSTPTTAPVGAGTTPAPPREGSTAPPSTGIDLIVVDPNFTPRAAVVVRIEPEGGSDTITEAAAGDGHLRRVLPPGRYRAGAVLGCADQLEVLRSGAAEFGVADGQTTSGRLVVEVQPRYDVAGVTYDGDASWRVGELHAVRFRLVDRCQGRPPSPAAYRAVEWVANEGVEVVRPLSTDVGDDGSVHVDLRCTSADVDVELAMVDRDDDLRRTEVLLVPRLREQQPPFCVQPR